VYIHIRVNGIYTRLNYIYECVFVQCVYHAEVVVLVELKFQEFAESTRIVIPLCFCIS
jgi:hypothetical protein